MRFGTFIMTTVCGAFGLGFMGGQVSARELPPEVNNEPSAVTPDHKAKTDLKPSTFSGQVKDVLIQETSMGEQNVLQLKVRDGTKAYVVNLAPAAYVKGKAFSFARGDYITVKGLSYDLEGQTTVIAASVTKGSKTLVLRDKAGRPTWWTAKAEPTEDEEEGGAGDYSR